MSTQLDDDLRALDAIRERILKTQPTNDRARRSLETAYQAIGQALAALAALETLNQE